MVEGVALMGKGSKRRPAQVDRDTWTANWERAFGAEREASEPKLVEPDSWEELQQHWDRIREYRGLPSLRHLSLGIKR